MGLVRAHYDDAFVELADLLADPEIPARVAAARAIAYSENRERGVPLLRLRVKVGDVPEVLGECFMALLNLAARESIALVAASLKAPEPQIQEAAALALGESRLPAALPLLQAWWERAREPELRGTGLLAIAMLRSEAAVDFLLGLLSEAEEPEVQQTLAALELYRGDVSLEQRIEAILVRRGWPQNAENT